VLPNNTFSNALNPTPLQNVPGYTYNSESGLVITVPGESPAAGLADYGTRLKAVFQNVPAGVSIYVTTTNTASGNIYTGTANTSASLPAGNLNSLAYLVLGETAPDYGISGLGFAPTVSATTTVSGVTLYQVPLTTGPNGALTGEAVWEVVQSNPNLIDTLDFGVYYVYTANQSTNTPAVGTYTVGQSFAPTPTGSGLATTFTSASGGAASSSLTIPRFVDTTGNNTNNYLKIGLCQTTLLFPFVTNENGFETGISIANTSTDTLGTTPQTGTCALTFYGDNPGPTTTTAPCTAAGSCLGGAAIKTGTGFASTLTAILGSSFQGYAIATCNFQYAHAFVFISDAHATNLAMGYLGLVVNGGVQLTNERGAPAESLEQ